MQMIETNFRNTYQSYTINSCTPYLFIKPRPKLSLASVLLGWREIQLGSFLNLLFSYPRTTNKSQKTAQCWRKQNKSSDHRAFTFTTEFSYCPAYIFLLSLVVLELSYSTQGVGSFHKTGKLNAYDQPRCVHETIP